ncbi:hypothetical protein F5984_13785 [Rudanella paleaurantiibacter]|uniref:Uncharacterized protein n=1 Tax=Rudanella paleaurantiibacter TaxID=2614655 RepID=A0A7J5TYL3_9BACT|nr:hypothetical protein [Rudanella paleaurantiibacter]KAB7730239.1 hypothetical protein F5984_13785 [Rudanella paleaurantiibacter]
MPTEVSVDVSPYKLKRGKPELKAVHVSIQANLTFDLKLRYRETHRIMSEVSLATTPGGTTSDGVQLNHC